MSEKIPVLVTGGAGLRESNPIWGQHGPPMLERLLSLRNQFLLRGTAGEGCPDFRQVEEPDVVRCVDPATLCQDLGDPGVQDHIAPLQLGAELLGGEPGRVHLAQQGKGDPPGGVHHVVPGQIRALPHLDLNRVLGPQAVGLFLLG